MYTGYEIYNKNNEYSTKDGQIYTPEMFEKDYTAVHSQTIAVRVYGNTIVEAHPMSYLRGINKIENDVSDEEAIAQINAIQQINETENTPIERIASSLEYLVLLFMGDKSNEF